MDAPISAIARKAIQEFALNRTLPDTDTLHALGIDVQLLEQRCNEMKSILAHIDGFTKIENDKYMLGYYEQWAEIVAWSPFSGAKTIRLTDSWGNILFSGGAFAPLELFLTRKGEWIAWDGTLPAENETGPQRRLTHHRSVRAMLKRLDELLEPIADNKPQNYPAFRVLMALRAVLDQSIHAKQQRLNPQLSMRERFAEVDKTINVQR